MRRISVILMLALVLSFCGCFKVDVNVPSFGGSNGSNSSDVSKAPSQPGTSGLPGVSSTGGWRDIAEGVGGYMMGAQNGVVFFGYDTLAYPGEPVTLAARIQNAKNLQGYKDVLVTFSLDDKSLAVAASDETGLAGIEWTPPKDGIYRFTVQITGADEGYETLLKLDPATVLVLAKDKKTEFVVIDLDHTLVDSSFFRVLMGGAKPMADSIKVTNKIAEKYSIVYLTQRPDILTSKSKRWIVDNGYPDGPVLMAELKNVMDSGKYKTDRLKQFREAYPNVKIGIGDKFSDAQAYVDNGLTAYLIPNYKHDKVKDLRKTAKAVRDLKSRGGRLHVINDWNEIDEAFSEGKKFPPDTFAKNLDKKADRLEAEKRRKDKDDDDD